jgi:hypothetical protein
MTVELWVSQRASVAECPLLAQSGHSIASDNRVYQVCKDQIRPPVTDFVRRLTCRYSAPQAPKTNYWHFATSSRGTPKLVWQSIQIFRVGTPPFVAGDHEGSDNCHYRELRTHASAHKAMTLSSQEKGRSLSLLE